jgi:hypothetical protein
LIALVQASAETNVKAGENEGRVLDHVQIVRKLLIEPMQSGQGTATFTVPEAEANWEVIGMLQNKTNGTIIGAGKTYVGKTVNSN